MVGLPPRTPEPVWATPKLSAGEKRGRFCFSASGRHLQVRQRPLQVGHRLIGERAVGAQLEDLGRRCVEGVARESEDRPYGPYGNVESRVVEVLGYLVWGTSEFLRPKESEGSWRTSMEGKPTKPVGR